MSNPVYGFGIFISYFRQQKSSAHAKLFIVLFFLFSLFFTVDAAIYLVFLI